MASRFSGRDYNTLREEIISFLRQRLPRDWDSTNLADPIVIFAESLARVGDQLHYTIDELRRECDMATAKRASSIYSYAMREGYKMMLPRGSFGTLQITSNKFSSVASFGISKFDEIKVAPLGITVLAKESISGTLYAKPDSESLYGTTLDPLSKDTIDRFTYLNTLNERIIQLPVVIGKKSTFSFTYSDINTDSTVELPTPIIDRDTLSLSFTHNGAAIELTYVDDIIGSGFDQMSFTLTPKFIGGAIVLCIEFPTNYRDLFESGTNFTFTYVSISDTKIDPTTNTALSFDLSPYITGGDEYEVDCGAGIKGYVEYEDPITTRSNYKRYVQNYSALLTKDDYVSYVKASTPQQCIVFDHSDMYKQDVLPSGAGLIERTMYVVTDAPFSGRKALWNDLKERSSRSDCIVMIPFGKDPYTIIVKADCYLVGTSVSDIATQIKSALIKYYTDEPGTKYPDESMINYIVHKASDKVIRMESCLVSDSTFGTIDSSFNNVHTLTSNQVEALYYALKNNSTLDDSINDYQTINSHILIDAFNTHKYASWGNRPAYGFPSIYLKDDMLVTDYSNLVKHQVVYGELDSVDWDLKDTDIFEFIGGDASAISVVSKSDTGNKIFKEVTGKDWDGDDDHPYYLTADEINRLRLNYTVEDLSGNITVSGAKEDFYVLREPYIKHHYVVPVLNNVVVLINAVAK